MSLKKYILRKEKIFAWENDPEKKRQRDTFYMIWKTDLLGSFWRVKKAFSMKDLVY